jgi:hypothetical protein
MRVEKYFKYRNWNVRRGYFPSPSDPGDYHFIVSHGSSQIAIFCATSGMNSYITSLRDFLSVRARYQWGRGVQLVYVSADIVPLGHIIEARESDVYIFHYRELAELCSLDPATPASVAGMLDRKLSSLASSLKLSEPAGSQNMILFPER